MGALKNSGHARLGRDDVVLATRNLERRETALRGHRRVRAGVDKQAKDWDGRTALGLAVENGHEAVTRLLLEIRSVGFGEGCTLLAVVLRSVF